jgi:DNA primase
VLFGIDRARGAAARTGSVILVEGYTDVLALHQAGLQNTVGIMGTALTDEQVDQLRRVAPVLELCLDADRAGQDAMLRAAQLSDRRNLQLRVVPLPDGTDPAEMIERAGADALRERVAGSVPFVAFHVERILERSDTSSAEGRDRAFKQLLPALQGLERGAFGDELLRRVAGRLELSEARLASLIEGAARQNGSSGGATGAENGDRGTAPTQTIDQAARAERTFLGLCVALPDAGARMLFEIDHEQLITSELMRRAARHIAGRTHAPLSDLPVDDEQLARTVADLVSRAARAGPVSQDQLEHARLVLERARLERAIRRARAEGSSGIGELAREREAVLERIRQVVGRLERAV